MARIGDENPRNGSGSGFTAFLNRVGGVFLAPDTTFDQIIKGRVSFWEPFVLILLLVGVEGAVLASFVVRVTSAIISSLSLTEGLSSSGLSFGLLSILPWIMIATMIVSVLIFWIILAGIAHLIAKFIFRGSGSFANLLRLYGYSLIPYSLVIFGTVLVGMSWVTWPLAIFFHVIAIFWIVLLMIVAVKHNYAVDTGKAFVSSFVGPMIVWLAMVSACWLWIWLTINSIAGGFT